MSDEQREKQEKEANSFALALLMPQAEFIRQLKKRDIDLSDPNDERYLEIAKTFGVSLNAVVARVSMLSKLNLI